MEREKGRKKERKKERKKGKKEAIKEGRQTHALNETIHAPLICFGNKQKFNESMLRKISAMSDRYGSWRRVRGDG